MRNEKITIGTVEQVTLGEMDILEDEIYIITKIEAISENLQSRIHQAMETEKAKSEEWMMDIYGRGWKETVIKDLTLDIVAKKDNRIKTYVSVYFEEIDDEDIYEIGKFEIDLSEYESEIKRLFMKAIVDRFF